MTFDPKTHYSDHFAHTEFNRQGNPDAAAAANLHRLCNDILEPARPHAPGGRIQVTEEGGFRPPALQQAIWEAALAANGGDVAATLLHVAHPGHSQHEVGNAADVYIPDAADRARFIAYLVTNPAVGGIGEYPWGVHVDRRPRVYGAIARW